jgi:hypothetical protein
MSVASTSAPSRAMAIAVARPMPCAAAVTNALLPASLPLIMLPFLTIAAVILSRCQS